MSDVIFLLRGGTSLLIGVLLGNLSTNCSFSRSKKIILFNVMHLKFKI